MTAVAECDLLTQDECLALLALAPIGRVVHTDRAMPTLTPVRFAMDRGDVVLQVTKLSSLGRLMSGTVVAFEVDDFDGQTGCGCSVVVTGRVVAVTAVESSAPDDRLIRVHPDLVTGRRMAASASLSAGQRHPPHDLSATVGQGLGGESPTE